MESTKAKVIRGSKRVVMVTMLAGGMGLALLLSLGIGSRNAKSSGLRDSVAVEPTRGSEASGVAADGDRDFQQQRVPGHPELDLQLD